MGVMAELVSPSGHGELVAPVADGVAVEMGEAHRDDEQVGAHTTMGFAGRLCGPGCGDSVDGRGGVAFQHVADDVSVDGLELASRRGL